MDGRGGGRGIKGTENEGWSFLLFRVLTSLFKKFFN